MTTSNRIRQAAMRYKFTLGYVAVVVTVLLVLQITEVARTW